MNIPNALSVIRLVMTPVFILALIYGGEHARLLAALVYVLASVTDVLDGYIARKLNMVTMLGRILDPLADKLMTAAVLISLGYYGLAPWWAVVIYIVKELIMGIAAIIMYKDASDIMPSNVAGKMAAFVFFLVCTLLLVYTGISTAVAHALIIFSLFFSIFALVIYIPNYVRFTKRNKP